MKFAYAGKLLLVSTLLALNNFTLASTLRQFIGGNQSIEELLAKLSAIDAGSASTIYTNDLIELNALFTSAAGMKAVAADTTAMNSIVGSIAALDAVIHNTIAMNAIAASSLAMTIVEANSTAMNAAIASTIAMNAIVASTTAMNVVAASSTAMATVLANSTAMTIVVGSSTALSSIIKTSTPSTSLETALATYRTSILTTLSLASNFTLTTINVGSGGGTFPSSLANSFYIPTTCYDDSDTDYTADSSLGTSLFLSIDSHGGYIPISTGVAMGGVTVYGVGASIGYVRFDVYTAN